MTDAIFSFITVAFQLGTFALALSDVGSENAVFVRMIQRVRQDLEETERIIRVPAVNATLISIPGKIPWIKSVILSTKEALNEIGKWVDRARAEKMGFGAVTFETKVRWVLSDHHAVVARKEELTTCHQSLLTVLNYLQPLEPTKSASESAPPDYTDATSLDDLLSPRQRKKISKPSTPKVPDPAQTHEKNMSLIQPPTASQSLEGDVRNATEQFQPTSYLNPSPLHCPTPHTSTFSLKDPMPQLCHGVNHLGPVDPFEQYDRNFLQQSAATKVVSHSNYSTSLSSESPEYSLQKNTELFYELPEQSQYLKQSPTNSVAYQLAELPAATARMRLGPKEAELFHELPGHSQYPKAPPTNLGHEPSTSVPFHQQGAYQLAELSAATAHMRLDRSPKEAELFHELPGNSQYPKASPTNLVYRPSTSVPFHQQEPYTLSELPTVASPPLSNWSQNLVGSPMLPPTTSNHATLDSFKPSGPDLARSETVAAARRKQQRYMLGFMKQ